MKGPTSPVRENISPVRQQRKSPVRELSLSPVREDQSPLRLTSKTSKKHHGEGNDSEKRKKIRPSDEVLTSMPHNQMAFIQNLKESHSVSVCRA